MDKKILVAYGSKRGSTADIAEKMLSLQPVIERIHPRAITCFGGKLVLKTLNPFEKWIINKVKAPEGDFRDWQAVASWANTIRKEL